MRFAMCLPWVRGSGGRSGWLGSNPPRGGRDPSGSGHPESEKRPPGSSRGAEPATPTPEPQVAAAARMGLSPSVRRDGGQDTGRVSHYHPGEDFMQRQLDRRLEFLLSQIVHYLQQHLNNTDKGSVIRT